MLELTKRAIIAVDLGNTRAKFGYFPGSDTAFPEPESTFVNISGDLAGLIEWLEIIKRPVEWRIARTDGRNDILPWDRIQRKLEVFRPDDVFKELGRWDVPVAADVESQEKVGIDRLLAAFGAVMYWKNRYDKDSLLLVVDAGSATTIDIASTHAPKPFLGTMGGGAIIPGLAATASALADISPRLPKIPTENLSFASYPGFNTEEALAAGIYWGAVGTILHFHKSVQKIINVVPRKKPMEIPVFLAGGDAEKLHSGLIMHIEPNRLILLPDLVLNAIALAARYPSVAPPSEVADDF